MNVQGHTGPHGEYPSLIPLVRLEERSASGEADIQSLQNGVTATLRSFSDSENTRLKIKIASEVHRSSTKSVVSENGLHKSRSFETPSTSTNTQQSVVFGLALVI
jgi:hypothetical protein